LSRRTSKRKIAIYPAAGKPTELGKLKWQIFRREVHRTMRAKAKPVGTFGAKHVPAQPLISTPSDLHLFSKDDVYDPSETGEAFCDAE
jgi:hypothetical protein